MKEKLQALCTEIETAMTEVATSRGLYELKV